MEKLTARTLFIDVCGSSLLFAGYFLGISELVNVVLALMWFMIISVAAVYLTEQACMNVINDWSKQKQLIETFPFYWYGVEVLFILGLALNESYVTLCGWLFCLIMITDMYGKARKIRESN